MILPSHGAFPELIDSTQGGLLFAPGDLGELVDAIDQLHQQVDLREQFAEQGRSAVMQKHSVQQSALAMKAICSGEHE